jgi:hypothetical protein
MPAVLQSLKTLQAMARDVRTKMKSLTFIFLFLTINLSFGQKEKVLRGHQTLVYLTTFADSTKKIFITDTIRFITTDIPWRAQPDKQLTAVWKYSPDKIHDTIRKKLFSIGWLDADSTGAVETKKIYWIHPPRNNQFSMTEIAPFPIVQFPCELNKKYDFKLIINYGWGEWSDLELRNTYEIVAKELKTVDNSNYECWVVKSQNESKLGKSQLTTKYNDSVGFVEFNYQFYNKATLIINLVKVY